MSKEANIALQTRFGEAINSGNLDSLRELVSPGVVDHDPGPQQGPGAQGYIDLFAEMRAGFPDLQATPEHITADEDTVAMAYTLTGTHNGEFQGIAPTNKKIKARGVQIARFKDGQLVERWGSSDELGILKQLGAEPKKPGGILEKIGLG